MTMESCSSYSHISTLHAQKHWSFVPQKNDLHNTDKKEVQKETKQANKDGTPNCSMDLDN